jgi:hypothetical protein
MALARKPETPELKNFQCRVIPEDAARWQKLNERAAKMKGIPGGAPDLHKSFAEHFSVWLNEVEAELNTVNVKPIRTPKVDGQQP